MTRILALETATEACSAALMNDDGTISERFEVAPRRHTEIILPMIAGLLDDAGLDVADLDAIAFGAGPGSFTGVRVAASVAQGIALAHELPVIPLSCLATLAVGGARQHDCATVIPVMDARRQEIYWAVYRVDHARGVIECVEADAIGTVNDIRLPDSGRCIIVGSATQAYRKELLGKCSANTTLGDEPVLPRAADAVMLAVEALRSNATVAPEFAEPVYLRRAV